jgi:hypothetical protein
LDNEGWGSSETPFLRAVYKGFVIKKVILEKNCHATEKSEAIAMCKEMRAIPVNKVVDKKSGRRDARPHPP